VFRLNRTRRSLIIGVAAAAGLGLPVAISPLLFGANSIFRLTDPGAVGTVLAAFVALFGVVFTAVFSEITAYYKDRGLGMQQKWQLVFPMLRDYYNPWIQDASYLSNYLREIKNSESFSAEQATRVLFYISLFFTTRLRFSTNAGGRPILAQDSDEQNVLDAYHAVEKLLDWTDHAKRRTEVGYLQRHFMAKDKPGKPYTSDRFIQDARSDRKMQAIRNEIRAWLTKQRAEKVAAALDEFQLKFRLGINKLYSGWAS
jgi:hypothetical protein